VKVNWFVEGTRLRNVCCVLHAVFLFTYSSTLKKEAICSSEMSVDFSLTIALPHALSRGLKCELQLQALHSSNASPCQSPGWSIPSVTNHSTHSKLNSVSEGRFLQFQSEDPGPGDKIQIVLNIVEVTFLYTQAFVFGCEWKNVMFPCSWGELHRLPAHTPSLHPLRDPILASSGYLICQARTADRTTSFRSQQQCTYTF
jgi:hypothetical protein